MTAVHPIFEKIIQSHIPCVFVSPHLDDTVLSSGGLMSLLAPKTLVTNLTVFTHIKNPRSTLSAKQTLRNAGVQNAYELYDIRRQEDHAAFGRLHIRTENLGFTEALWRMKKGVFLQKVGACIPEVSAIYPTYRKYVESGNVSRHDTELIADIAEKISGRLSSPQSILFSPLGVGNHVDHLVTRLACEKVTSQIIYYSDFPYNFRTNSWGVPPQGYEILGYKPDMREKDTLIQAYTSQVSGLFANGDVPEHTEVFFVPLSLR